MGSYMYFFVKGKDYFYPIACHGVGSSIYDYFNYPILSDRPISLKKDTINLIYYKISNDIDKLEISINRLHDLKETICNFNNTMEEKYEAIAGIYYDIDEEERKKQELVFVKWFCKYLLEVIDIGEDMKYCDDPPSQGDYLYFGIDCDTFPVSNGV